MIIVEKTVVSIVVFDVIGAVDVSIDVVVFAFNTVDVAKR